MTPAILVAGSSLGISTTPQTELDPVTPATYAALDCLARDIQMQPGTATEIDTSAICSTAKEFVLGLRDFGNMSITGHWKIGHPAHAVILEAAADQKTRLIKLTFSDLSTATGLAYVQQPGFSGSVDGVWSGTYSFRFTGEVVYDEAP